MPYCTLPPSGPLPVPCKASISTFHSFNLADSKGDYPTLNTRVPPPRPPATPHAVLIRRAPSLPPARFETMRPKRADPFDSHVNTNVAFILSHTLNKSACSPLSSPALMSTLTLNVIFRAMAGRRAEWPPGVLGR